MRGMFDTVTDWFAIPVFIAAMAFFVRADLISLHTPEEQTGSAYQLARQAGALLAAVALLVTRLRFAVLAAS